MKYKNKVRSLNQALRVSLLAATCLCSGLGTAYAGPEGGTVTYGNATIEQGGLNTTINQNSQRAVIDWQSFNVGQHELVNFIQPGVSAVAVNRIHDVNPSTILGQLNANGQVVLINPNGVVFGAGSHVDVNGLVVSAASPSEHAVSDFAHGLRNDLPLSQAGRPDAIIYNAGNITAHDAGLIGFVAPNVINDGILIANSGTIQLASGSTATLDLYGDGLIDIAVDPAVQSQLIAQRGWVQADGGKVAITAAAGEQIVNSIINMSGVTQAQSIEQRDGKIILSGDNSTIDVTGTLDASGIDNGETGGEITLTAHDITLNAGSLLDASGDRGGGTIKIGGDYKGQGSLSHAKTVTVEQGAVIHNDALTNGNGGQTIVWSDDLTSFAGTITSTGGSHSGHGGFVETSGQKDLNVTGHVNLMAAFGETGDWLLDPTNITIYNRSQGGTDNTNTFTTAYLESASASANIALSATNNITLNLTSDTMTLASNRSLSLTAGNQITTASAGTIITNGGGISFFAPNGILLNHNTTLTSNGGTITFGNNVTQAANTTVTANASGGAGTGDIIASGSISRATGAASTLNLTAGRDVNLTGGVTSVTGNKLTINATAGRDLSFGSGLNMQNISGVFRAGRDLTFGNNTAITRYGASSGSGLQFYAGHDMVFNNNTFSSAATNGGRDIRYGFFFSANAGSADQNGGFVQNGSLTLESTSFVTADRDNQNGATFGFATEVTDLGNLNWETNDMYRRAGWTSYTGRKTALNVTFAAGSGIASGQNAVWTPFFFGNFDLTMNLPSNHQFYTPGVDITGTMTVNTPSPTDSLLFQGSTDVRFLANRYIMNGGNELRLSVVDRYGTDLPSSHWAGQTFFFSVNQPSKILFLDNFGYNAMGFSGPLEVNAAGSNVYALGSLWGVSLTAPTNANQSLVFNLDMINNPSAPVSGNNDLNLSIYNGSGNGNVIVNSDISTVGTLSISAGVNGLLSTSTTSYAANNINFTSSGNISLANAAINAASGNGVNMAATGDINLASPTNLTLGNVTGSNIIISTLGSGGNINIAAGRTVSASGTDTSLIFLPGGNLITNGSYLAAHGEVLVLRSAARINSSVIRAVKEKATSLNQIEKSANRAFEDERSAPDMTLSDNKSKMPAYYDGGSLIEFSPELQDYLQLTANRE